MVVLTIGAHPADVFDLAGGTLANFSAHGHDVFLAVLTHGAYSHAQVLLSDKQQHALKDVSALKRRECDEATQHVGIKGVRYFDFDDEPFIITREAVLALGECVREVRPDIVITHHPQEYGHPDHPVVGELVLRSLKAAERWLEGSEREAHPMKKVYFFGTQFRGIVGRLGAQVVPADFIVNIADSIEKKKKALVAFQSQSFKGAQYEEKWVDERLTKIEGHWGFMSGLKYAEEFIALLPQVVDLLP
jgi:LmbE family N-acetylglucosaminyl deacetylase